LFRTLFIAYAEDRDLLPYKHNEIYRNRSLKQKAQELSEKSDSEISQGSHHWNETLELFRAIYIGKKEWGIPEYAGTIFSNDRAISEAGFLIDNIKLENQYFEKALKSLITIDTDSKQIGPVDFRSLSVREFGTVYEGLLESELSQAEFDLTRDKKENYIPAKDGNTIYVKKGEIYLHNKSGARKSSGSFFTPDFAVEHLLDKSLEPALQLHFSKIDSLDDLNAAEELFNFRVADIAMGSGHFLVAAIDRIEMRFTEYLDKRPLALVKNELNTLKISALNQLKDFSEQKIEDIQLLKRLIARRCIYGVDLNPLSVQLARLSIWIHTFVPGLPLSLLDHSIRHGNSLVGVGSIDEIKNKIDEAKDTLFAADSEALIKEASQPLMKFAKINDATISDVNKARELISEAKRNIEPIKALCNLITAHPITDCKAVLAFPFEDWEARKESIMESSELESAEKDLDGLSVFHFPVEFPEIFISEKKGFDVLLGNPPWDSVKLEEQKFWARYFPGMRSMSQREYEKEKENLYEKRPDLLIQLDKEKREADNLRSFLMAGNYPGISKGDADLYKAFSWRFINLLSTDGYFGVVLPRSVLNGAGSAEFRKNLFNSSSQIFISTLLNNQKWVFEDIHPQYTVALIIIKKGFPNNKKINLQGAFRSLKEFINDKINYSEVHIDDLAKYDENLAIPILPGPNTQEIFNKMREVPSISVKDENLFHVKSCVELHATQQKNLMDLENEKCPENFWPIYKGASFDLWSQDTGVYHAWGDPKKISPWIIEKKSKSNLDNNPFAKPRILLRMITNKTNQRTTICALVPPNIYLQHSANYLEVMNGDKKDEAFILGVLSSIPFDWFSRTFIELNFTNNFFNIMPMPRLKKESIFFKKIVKLSGRLASSDVRFKEWANQVGVECGSIEELDKEAMIYELDALVAHAFKLSEIELIRIYETFHVGWDYTDRLERVIEYFRQYQS